MNFALTLLPLLALFQGASAAEFSAEPMTSINGDQIFYTNCVTLKDFSGPDFGGSEEVGLATIKAWCAANVDCTHFYGNPNEYGVAQDCSNTIGDPWYINPPLPSFFSMAKVQDKRGLFETWYLAERAFNYGQEVFDLTYRMSDAMTSPQTDAQLYYSDPDIEKACTRPYPDNEVDPALSINLPGVVKNPEASGNIYMTGQQEVAQVLMDGEKLEFDTTYNPVGSGDGEVEFCIRYGLSTAGLPGGDEEVNFLETIVVLTLNLTAGFDAFEVSGIKVEPLKKEENKANVEYKLEAFQCRGKTAEGGTKWSGTPPTFNQGDAIRICVQPNETARTDNIFMDYVEKLEYVLMDKDDASVEATPRVAQMAIENKATMFGLTNIDPCKGEVACVIDTILFASFYTRPGTVKATGSAVMQFGDAGTDGNAVVPNKRKLRGVEERVSRRTQTNPFGAAATVPQPGDSVGDSEFDVNFKISTDDTFTRASGAASIAMYAAALVGSFATFFLM